MPLHDKQSPLNYTPLRDGSIHDTDSEPQSPIPNRLRRIGRAMLDRLSNKAEATPAINLPSELMIPNAEPANLTPPHTERYPRDPLVAGLEIPDTPDGPAWALAYAQAVFPKSQLSVLSTESSSGIVLEDKTGHVYKVFARATIYEYIEKEAATLQHLGDLGIAPRLHLLVDAAPQYRADDLESWQPYVKDDISIPRQEAHLPLPVIVMDKIDAAEPAELSTKCALEEFDRLSRIVLEHHISLGDTELVLNRETGRLMFVDIGGVTVHKNQQSIPTLWPVTQNDRSETINASREASLIRGLAFQFLPFYLPEIDQAARTGGAPAVRAVVEAFWDKPYQGQV